MRWGAIAVAVLLLVAAACTAEDPPSGAAAEEGQRVAERDLHGASAVAVGEEIWVLGGMSAPEGTRPPSTGGGAPGWDPNRLIVVYDTAGERLRQIQLPDDLPGMLVPAVYDVGGAHHVLTSECGDGNGCSAVGDPILLRVVEDRAERVGLTLPPAAVGGVNGGALSPLGVTGSTAWALQLLGDRCCIDLASRGRLLAIDLTTGAATEVVLPGAVYDNLLCVSGGHLVAVQAQLGADGRPTGGTVLRHPGSVEGDWTPIATFPVPSIASSGSVGCSPTSEEVVVTVGGYPAEIHSLSVADGAPLAGTSSIDGSAGRGIVLADGRALVMGNQMAGNAVAIAHGPGGTWHSEPSPAVSRLGYLVIVGSELYDAHGLVGNTRGGSVELLELTDP